jgi:DNA-binding MarR family transcriptional regulator
MENFTEELDEAIGKFYNSFERMTKKPRDYGCGELLYPSEIHIIEMIGKYPDLNTTDLADRQGVTKGSISQMTSKLEKKGFIKKFQYIDNKKEIFYKLTEKGKTAYEGHIKYHENRDMEAYEEFENYTEEQKKFLLKFFKRHTKYLKQYVDD